MGLGNVFLNDLIELKQKRAATLLPQAQRLFDGGELDNANALLAEILGPQL